MFENNNKEEITPLFDEKTLLKLLNLFPPDFENIESIISILCHSPYPIEVIKRVCYQLYNKKEHENWDIIEEYINKYYEYEKSNKWFDAIINKYYEPQTIKDFGWTDEDEKIYNKLAFKQNKTLSQKQRKQKEEIKNKRADIKYMLKDSLTKEEKKRNKTRKYFVNLFRDLKRIITPYDFDEDYYNKLFKVGVFPYILNECNILERINKKEFKNIIIEHDINENKLTRIYDDEEYEYIRKYNDVFLLDKYKGKVEETLNIFKSSFVNEYDYIYYMRWLSMKLNNPCKLIPHNIVCLFGNPDVKTTFINAFAEFIKTSNISYNAVVRNRCNEWILSSIVIIDEVPCKVKDGVGSTFQSYMHCLSSNYVALNPRCKEPKMINHCANYIINSDYFNCGGLFSNQADGEIFGRFKIIKNQTIKDDDEETFYNNIKDKHILYNLYKYIKNEFKPMDYEEIREVSEYEHEYEQIVWDLEYGNKRVLDHDTIKECTNKKKQLKINFLVDKLRDAGYKTSIFKEREFLLQKHIITSSGKYFVISDYDKFKEIYMKKDNKKKTKTDNKNDNKNDNKEYNKNKHDND